MDDIREKKAALRTAMREKLNRLSPEEIAARQEAIEASLFEFANFMEARVPLLYAHQEIEVNTDRILEKSASIGKIVVLPAFYPGKRRMGVFKVDHLGEDLKDGPRGVPEPDEFRCKKVPLDKLDIAIIPGYAFDEKGGRIGSGKGYYDRLIPRLSITTRKVALAFEEQITSQIPMESHDKYVDIIITDQRVIYKI